MPNYRFEFVGEAADPITLTLADENAAREEARVAMAEMLRDTTALSRDGAKMATKIYDEAGYLLCTVTYSEVVSELGEIEAPESTPDAREPETDEAGDEPGVMRAG